MGWSQEPRLKAKSQSQKPKAGAADRRLYEALRAGDYGAWRATSLRAVEDAGQQEVLNWFAFAGAMEELGARLEWSEFVETHVLNSNKVFAVYGTA